MSQDFILPDIGEGIVECELLKWLVKEGDIIAEDQPIAEVMTDKATVEIPAMHDGVVEKLYYREGDIAKVHQPLFRMRTQSDSNSSVELTKSAQSSSIMHDSKACEDKTTQQNNNTEVFYLPDIGEGIVECEIVKWSVKEGDLVSEDQVVVEVMTDKAVVEIPAKHAGVVSKLHYKQGDIAKVHAPLFDLTLQLQNEESVTTTNSTNALTHADDSLATVSTGMSREKKLATGQHSKQGENFCPTVACHRPIASPAVRRLARECDLDLNHISGSGAKGRILKQDINAAMNSGVTIVKQDTLPSNASVPYESGSQDRREPIRGVRAVMARQMKASVYSIPHFSVSDELEMDTLMVTRTQLKGYFEGQGMKLSFMPFFIKALSLALQDYPIINSQLSEDESELIYKSSHNVGFAVDSKIGLLVPNIKNVQDKSLFEVTAEVNRLIQAARDGRLENRDLSGGTISISNIGAIGGITATPIINKPEVAIVALGKTQKLPRFDANGHVIAKHLMSVNWSGDHRVIDGATMVKFNNLWMDYLTHPEKMLIMLR